MPSHSLKRAVSGALTACFVFALVGVPGATAVAAPTPAPQEPSNTSDALQKYRDLASKAEKLSQSYLRAKEDLESTQDKLDKANEKLKEAQKQLERAKEKKERYRDRVDQIASASFSSGAQFTKLSVLLHGDSTSDLLERSAALNLLAKQKTKVLDELSSAVQKAKEAKQQADESRSKAQEAKDKAVSLLEEIEKRKDKVDEQIDKVKQAGNLLSAEDKAKQQDTGGDVPDVDAPGSAAQQAVNAALNQRGTPYVWGGTTPSGFDCSGLVQWAYAQAGVDLPRTAGEQAQVGQPVPRSQLKPGDIVYFYSPVSHDGIYIGNGKMVHAPHSGAVVRVQEVYSNGYMGARRVT